MAWVKNGRYYQKSIRINGRVTTQYWGSYVGAGAEFIDRELRARREQLRAEAAAIEAEQLEELRAERERGESIRQAISVALQAMGFVRYARNSWRKRRRMNNAPAVPGDKAASGGPDIAEIARLTLAATMGRQDERRIDRYLSQMEAKARELAGPDPSPAVELVAEAAAFAWCEHHLLSLVAATKAQVENEKPTVTRRRNAALNRLLAAMRTLARIKRLEVPTVINQAVQVNVTAARPGATPKPALESEAGGIFGELVTGDPFAGVFGADRA